MSILQDQPEPPSRPRKKFLLFFVLTAVIGTATYFEIFPSDWTSWFDAPKTTDDSPAPPPRVENTAPATEPTTAPLTPEIPEPEPAVPPEPAPEPAIEPAIPVSRPAPSLRVSSDVPEASVFLDREFLGTTPLEIIEVSRGPHRLNVSAEGQEGFAQTIEVGDEPLSIEVRFLEVRLNTQVEVVHKHRFGSCQGLLRADLEGIHYETGDDDAFSIPLSEIEEHTIDYLDHTLTLKHREGRTYNFTDEQENADALFVFQRDVEQARARLATASE